MIASVNPLLFLMGGGYTINQSLRFRASNSASLSRTPAGAGNRRTWTLSLWLKRGALAGGSSIRSVFSAGTGANDYSDLAFDASDRLWFYRVGPGGGTNSYFVTNAVYRDPTAHMHILLAWDTPQATAANRARVYVNGTEITSFSSTSYPAQNYDEAFFNTVVQHALGVDRGGTSRFFDGYMAEVNFIDGQALTPSSFGQTDTTTGAWVPRRYTGTYGTNGFYLPFNDATSTTTISQDRSGNGNNWTSSGISVTAGTSFDQMLDSPTNNYCTWSSIDRDSDVSVFDANLRVDSAGAAASHRMIRGTQFVSSGKFYFEITSGAGTAASGNVNVLGMDGGGSVATNVGSGSVQGFGFGYATDAGIYYTSGWSTSGSPPVMANTTYGIAVDLDTGRAWIRNSGGWFQGDPATNTSPTFTRSGSQVPLAPAWSYFNSPNPTTVYLNCGQRAFAYTPPTGFVAICTANLSTPTIQNGASAFQATLRTGTGASASVSSLAFQPDLVWIKSRSNATNHNLFDAVRGVNNGLVSNSTAAEYTDANSLTAFNSDGYTLGTDGSSRGVNINTNTYVDWAWREGAAYGFDIVTYAGTGSSRTVAHGLNAVPHMMIVKRRSAGASAWYIYHRNANASPASGALLFDTSAFSAGSFWNSTVPTSSVFSLGGSGIGVNDSGIDYIAYLWTSISGFSLFGSYTGNGSSDGPFVWCGFRPRFVLVKRVDSTGEWHIWDAARDTFNPEDKYLAAQSSAAEVNTGTNNIDFTASGFKLRLTAAQINASGGTYIFAAFAETPFKFANGR